MSLPFPYNRSPGIASGEILITAKQYSNLDPTTQKEFKRVPKPGCELYQYSLEASSVQEDDILFDGFVSDVEVVKAVCDSVSPPSDGAILFEMDADEDDFDYVQGVCYTALQMVDDTRDKEFILTYQFGDYWTLEIVWEDSCS